MKTSKIISLIFIFITFAFFHVFLQTEITKLGYEAKKNEDKLQELVDKNHILKYNICALESPYRLDKYLSFKDSDLKMLKPVQVVSLNSKSKQKYLPSTEGNSFAENPIFIGLKRFFSSRQAEAKTIK